MTQKNFIKPILIKAGDKKLLINGLAPLVDCRVIAEENYQKLITQFKPTPLPDDIKQWIEDENIEKFDGDDVLPAHAQGFRKGATAMYDLLSPQIEKEAIDFGKFLTKNGYELYNDGWALQKGKRCGKTNEQVYEQFKAQLAEQK